MAGFCVGVTGGVASGKSEVTRRFEALGIVVADADLAARAAVAAGSQGLAQVVATFGDEILDGQGALDRAAMRRIVFGDEAARRRLEAIVHPLVRSMLREQCQTAAGAYAIAAIPLLAEGGGRDAYPWLDRCLVVDVPVAVQQARVMRRDGIEAELAQRMIAAQATREARLAIADDVIVNDGPIDALKVQVEALDRRYRALAESLRD
ncbi:dephospho-CoA kinase [Lysobacter sp. CA199]|uniref:dephospho-CoA kinase n=1 Tax=Lysobacter sp. CA199 TaxID=3455608 RepID=UPI003F8D7363